MLSRNDDAKPFQSRGVASGDNSHGGDHVTKTLRIEPLSDNAALVAWQFLGQPLQEWPSWVQSNCSLQKDVDGKFELRHERRSGTQIVYLGEWLVRDLDGGVDFYTDAEIWSRFAAKR